MTKRTKQKLIDFAIQTLAVLERDTEWSSDTTDEISDLAFGHELAHTDEGGFFKSGKEEG